VEQSWRSTCIRFAVAPVAESGQHFEECQGFGGRWHGAGDGYATANCCQPDTRQRRMLWCGSKNGGGDGSNEAELAQPPWTDMLGSDLPCHRHRAPLIYFCCGHLRAAHSHEPIPCSNLPSAPLLSHTAHHVCQPFVARSARDKFPSYTPQPLKCRCAMRPPPRPKHPSILPWVSIDCPSHIRARL
jgi:hypothetical protein